MTQTSATTPITENDSQYYAGQYGPIQNLTGVNKTIWSFPDLNTVLISNYDLPGGVQVRDTGNFTLHLLATSTTIPSASNQIPVENIVVTNTTNNTVELKNIQGSAVPNNQFIFLQLTDIARGDNWGSYSYLTLNEVIDNWLMSYVGEDKIIQKIKRGDVLFHARRAMQELSYDTLKSYKSQELTVPTNLTVPIPKDYVNYTRLAFADGSGVLRTIQPLSGLSGNPTEMPIQDGATGIPSQSSYDTNLEAAQSLIEDRWNKANKNDITGNYTPFQSDGVFDAAWYKTAYGQRYGLDPVVSNQNGWFSINQRTGSFNFSSNLVNQVIFLSYISDGLSYTLNSIVPKLVEEAMYAQIASRIFQLRRDVDGGTKQVFKRDSYVKTRNAKIRLQNLKLDEITQWFRGQSKWIKH
jgi:hypothetical protein